MSDVMSVSMNPGATAFTRTPRPASSLESAFASCTTPPLEAAYEDELTPPKKESCEAVKTIAPPPCSTILRAAACATTKAEVRLMSRIRRQSSSVWSSALLRTIVPAFATRASIRSSRSTAAAASSGRARSIPVARSAVSTCQPSPRSRSATARPIPRLPPVTSATLAPVIRA